MLLLSLVTLSGAWAATALSGCSRGDSQGRDFGAVLRSEVRLALTFTRVAGSDDTAPVAFEGQGHFVRYSPADADQVSTLLGIPDDDSLPLDTCRLVDSADELDRALAAVPSTAEVRLLDAGRLLARGPVDAINFVPKHYPELTPYVAGVIYGPQDSLPLAFEPGALYEVAGEGGEEIGPFQAQAYAPRAFPSLAVSSYHRGGDLELRWNEPAEGADPMILTVGWSSRSGALEVRCRVRDDGAFTVGRELLASMPPDRQLAVAEVSATRSKRTPVTAPGASRGVLLLGMREVLPLPLAGVPLPSLVPSLAPSPSMMPTVVPAPAVVPAALQQGALPVAQPAIEVER